MKKTLFWRKRSKNHAFEKIQSWAGFYWGKNTKINYFRLKLSANWCRNQREVSELGDCHAFDLLKPTVNSFFQHFFCPFSLLRVKNTKIPKFFLKQFSKERFYFLKKCVKAILLWKHFEKRWKFMFFSSFQKLFSVVIWYFLGGPKK